MSNDKKERNVPSNENHKDRASQQSRHESNQKPGFAYDKAINRSNTIQNVMPPPTKPGKK